MEKMPSTKAIVSGAASVAATAMLMRTILREYLPTELRHYVVRKIKTIFRSFSPEITLVIKEYEHLHSNRLFQAAELYLEPLALPVSERLKVSLTKKQSQPTVSLDKNQEVVVNYKGAALKWRFLSVKDTSYRFARDPNSYNSVPIPDKNYFELSFHRKHKSLVLDDYLKHVVDKSKEEKEKKKGLKLFTLNRDGMRGMKGSPWLGVNLDHPATFDTLAMDVEVKRTIMEDLERFVRRKEFYKKVGKAWKRGYLLFGPPGTGKSSLIAAMANFLKFDVYDLELTDIRGNAQLRQLVINTANKSILVVEDIDCSLELQDRRTKTRASESQPPQQMNQPEVTLSGFLNFIDGLWSSCGDERIIVFTTNFREKLDPALFRPGRMDVHIHMSYCTPTVFKMLASNYLGVTEHSHFPEVEDLITSTNATPAEVGEQLMRSEDPEVTLRGLIKFLQEKKSRAEESEKAGSSTTETSTEEPKASVREPVVSTDKGRGKVEPFSVTIL